MDVGGAVGAGFEATLHVVLHGAATLGRIFVRCERFILGLIFRECFVLAFARCGRFVLMLMSSSHRGPRYCPSSSYHHAGWCLVNFVSLLFFTKVLPFADCSFHHLLQL